MAISRVTDGRFGGRFVRVLITLMTGAVCMTANTVAAGAAVPIGGGSTTYMFVANTGNPGGSGSVTFTGCPSPATPPRWQPSRAQRRVSAGRMGRRSTVRATCS
jgi:hypothetical protein